MEPLVSNEIARATLDSWDVLAGEEVHAFTNWLFGSMTGLMNLSAGGLVAGGMTGVLRPKSLDYHYLISAQGGELKVLQKGKAPDIVPPEWYELKGLIERYAPDMIGIDRASLRSDQLGMTHMQLAEMVGRVLGHLARLMAAALAAGTADLNYDGKPTFSATHYIDPQNKTGAQDNTMALALSPDNFFKGRSRMLSFVARDKQPISTSDRFWLLVPTDLEKVGLECVDAATVATGGTNVAKGKAQLVVSPELNSDPTRWYLLRGGGFAPLLALINEMPEPITIGPGMEKYETTKQLAYGLTVAWGARLGRWWQLLTSKP